MKTWKEYLAEAARIAIDQGYMDDWPFELGYELPDDPNDMEGWQKIWDSFSNARATAFKELFEEELGF